jgi:hypothetical protein
MNTFQRLFSSSLQTETAYGLPLPSSKVCWLAATARDCQHWRAFPAAKDLRAAPALELEHGTLQKGRV